MGNARTGIGGSEEPCGGGEKQGRGAPGRLRRRGSPRGRNARSANDLAARVGSSENQEAARLRKKKGRKHRGADQCVRKGDEGGCRAKRGVGWLGGGGGVGCSRNAGRKRCHTGTHANPTEAGRARDEKKRTKQERLS